MVAFSETTAIVEGADYLFDMEKCSYMKKRGRGSIRAIYDTEDGYVEESYLSFLDGLQEFWDAKYVEEDEDDPTYVMFLDSLKEYGNAYMLDVSLEHGLSSPVLYEVEDVPSDFPSDELKRKTPRARRGALLRERKSLDISIDLTSGLKTTHNQTLLRSRRSLAVADELDSGQKSSSSGKENTQRRSPRNLENSLIPPQKKKKKPIRKLSQEIDRSSAEGHNSDSRAHVVDEAYSDFMNGLKVVGESVFYEYGDCKRVFYEVSDQQRSTDVECEPPQVTPSPIAPTPAPRAPTPAPRAPTSARRAPNSTPKAPNSTPKAPNSAPKAPTSAPRAPNSTPKAPTSTPKAPNSAPKAPTSAPRAPSPASALTPTPRTPTLSDEMPKSNGYNPRPLNSLLFEDFKKRIQKRFEQKEYEDLWEMVKARKRVSITKDTRSGDYKVPGQMGKSYLDRYPDLNNEIKKVRSDSRKVLNLLRGFFWYLQHIPHRIPKPWLDESCKAILLQDL